MKPPPLRYAPETVEESEEDNYNAQQLLQEQHSLDLVKHFTEKISDKTEIPEDIKNRYWSMISPSAAATFNSEKDMPDFDLSINTLRLMDNMSKPPRHVKPEHLLQLDNVQQEAYNNFKRSIGSRTGNTNFLKLVFTQIQQIISSSFSGSMNRSKGLTFKDIRKFG